MRKIIGGVFLSLDGVMQAPGGPEEDPTHGFKYGGWSTSHWDERMGQVMDEFFKQPYDLLLGRRTYDIFNAHWGFVADHDPMGAAFTNCNKYVLTHGNQPLEWKNSHRMKDIEDVKRVKSGAGAPIIIQGSSSIYPPLLAAGLIDQLFLMIMPVVLGEGKRLFGAGTPGFEMKLVKHEVASTGVILATYEPKGPVTIGSFALDEPPPAELKRREKIKAGTW